MRCRYGPERARVTSVELPCPRCAVDVPIAPQAGVAGPLITGDRDEPAGLIEFRHQRVELRPELLRDLEVIALVAHGIDESDVAREDEVVPGRARADRLWALCAWRSAQ